MNTIETIRAEVLRLIRESDCSQWGLGKMSACNRILNFLDSLQEQPVCEGLEEYASKIVAELVPSLGQKYPDGRYVGGIRDYFSREELIGLVKAGAKWKMEQSESSCEGLEEDVKSWFFNEISSKINVEHTMYYYFQECARRYYELGRQSKPKVSEELEEEIYNYANTIAEGTPLFEIIPQTARHFAQWQREQMMKGAYDGHIFQCGFHNAVKTSDTRWTEKIDGFKVGDTVKLIIVKED